MNQQILKFFETNTVEMSVSFDAQGVITHTNPAANVTLDYPMGLAGVHISEVFAGTFEKTPEGSRTELSFGDSENPVMVYRRNRTCFPARFRYIHAGIPEYEYVCLLIDVTNEVFWSAASRR